VGRIFVRLLLGGIAGKALGVVREVLLAALFGAGRVVAANRIALTATLIPINFFTADALTAGFLPLYIKNHRENPALAFALYRSVRSALAVISLALAAALGCGSHVWVRLLAPGLDAQTTTMAATMLVVGAIGVPFYIQFNLYSLVALANDDVHLINIRASFQSVGLIGATALAFIYGNPILLAGGFTVPYAVLCGWAAYRVRRRGYLDPPLDSAASPEASGGPRVALGMFWQRLRPLLLIPLILQGSIAVERIVGSLLGVQVLAGSEYARFVVDSCMALLAAPLGLASLASFAKLDHGEVVPGLRRLVTPTLLVTVPLSLILCLNSEGIVTVLYARGRFDQGAVDATSIMLTGFAVGMWAQVLGYTLVKVLNARGSNAKATAVTAASFAAAAALNLMAYRQLGALTLGLATSVCGLIMFVFAAQALSVLRFSVMLLALMAPGAVVAGVAGHLLAGPGVGRLILSTSAICTLWLAYVFAVPSLRRSMMSGVKSWRRPRQAHAVLNQAAALEGQ
jgi:peptidoglycan biosynthesis protein MviN/MurJ (putative lipid II flippase)